MIGFLSPWLLLGLAALPVLWWLLRATPPAPLRRRFPGVVLLLGLEDRESEARRTPWWLLALRLLALGAAIVGFAGPVLDPAAAPVAAARPLLVLVDAGWPSARDWPARAARIDAALDQAEAAGRPVALLSRADPPPGPPAFTDAQAARAARDSLAPRPWDPRPLAAASLPPGAFDTLWLADGIASPEQAALAARLAARGALSVYDPPSPIAALGALRLSGEALVVPVLGAGPRGAVEVVLQGPDPAGVTRDLARLAVPDGAGEARFDLPPELRNRIARAEIAGARHAGAVSLTDDATKRRKVALVGSDAREGLQLLSGLHYLREALGPSADLIEGTLTDVLAAAPDAVVLVDQAEIPEAGPLAAWVEGGGLLIRFAGPRMAAAQAPDDLLPVRLRAGGRAVGGAMSWGAPRRLAPFAEGSPFAGLAAPPEVTVRAQVMAEPAPDLSDHVIAALEDGTPLVTRAGRGEGAIVLVHVTANAEWSSLPLSGLYVAMLERLLAGAGGQAGAAGEIGPGPWAAEALLDAAGRLVPAPEAPGVEGAALAGALAAPLRAPVPAPGLYRAGERTVALNVIGAGRTLARARWPEGVVLEGGEAPRALPLKGALLGAALALAALDILASLGAAGRLRAAAAALALVLVPLAAPPARAETAPARAVTAAGAVVLGHVATNDPALDARARDGLRGLGQELARRTTVEPAEPMAVDLETDDLALFPLLYWPVRAETPAPSAAAYGRLNAWLRAGGLLLLDTADADIAALGGTTPEGRRLQLLAAPLDIPPLEPVPQDHVLTRAFYLLTDFPGRHAGGAVWVEAAAPGTQARAEGMPFRQLNDGVTPVVIGGADWAAAWAVDAQGRWQYPVGRGMGGERQREMAYRFGINLVMHVLTGNYKSDQVHVPALLERLGQ